MTLQALFSRTGPEIPTPFFGERRPYKIWWQEPKAPAAVFSREGSPSRNKEGRMEKTTSGTKTCTC